MDLDPLAGHILSGREFAEETGIRHQRRCTAPMTTMAMAHVMRSMVIGELQQSDTYELEDRFLSFGRVGLSDQIGGAPHLLRSRAALPFEVPLSRVDPYLPVSPNIVILVAYEFTPERSLTLATQPAQILKIQGEGTQYVLLDHLEERGEWTLHSPSVESHEAEAETFDQGDDPVWFNDWDDLGEDEGLGS